VLTEKDAGGVSTTVFCALQDSAVRRKTFKEQAYSGIG
jgi:hypothetical protein